MKIAGQKNNGAWFRMNKWLRKYLAAAGNAQSGAQLKTLITGLDSFAPYLAALNELAAKVGQPAYTAALVENWVDGHFPLEVWIGKLLFDTYTQSMVNGKKVYKPDHAPAALQFGNDLRHTLIQFKMISKVLSDVGDVDPDKNDNPGGIPKGGPGPAA